MTLIIGDLHINSARISSCIMTAKLINWFKNLKENNKNNNLILLGDVLDTPTNSGATINYIVNLLNTFKFNKVYILIGNHDIFKNQDESEYKTKNALNWISQIKNYNNIEIVDYPKIITLENTNYLLLPYTNSYINLTDNNFNFSSINYILGHIDLGNYCLYNIDEIIKKSTNLQSIILGHIHTPSLSKYLNKDIYFIGSFYPIKHGENILNLEVLKQSHINIDNTNKIPRSYAIIDNNNFLLEKSPLDIIYLNDEIDDIYDLSIIDKIKNSDLDKKDILFIYYENIFAKNFDFIKFNKFTTQNNFIKKDLNSYYNDNLNLLVILKKDNDSYNFTEEINNLISNKSITFNSKSLLDYFNDFEKNLNLDEKVSNVIKSLLSNT